MDPLTPGLLGSVDAGRAVSPELVDGLAKRGRGRPRKDGSAPPVPAVQPGTGKPLGQPAPAWPPVLAGKILGAVHDLAAVSTGFAGWQWEDGEIAAAGPLLAEILDDALPYQGFRVKLALFALTLVAIDGKKLRDYKKFRADEISASAAAARAATSEAGK